MKLSVVVVFFCYMPHRVITGNILWVVYYFERLSSISGLRGLMLKS